MPLIYKTALSPAEETSFQDWYKKYASIHGLNSNPDASEHNYDYRGYWKSGPEPMSLFTLSAPPDTWKIPSDATTSKKTPTIEDLADFTGGFETFSATPYVLKTSSGKDQTLAGYGSANPEIIKLAQEGKLTKELAKKEMIRRLQFDYDEWTKLLPEFSNLPEEVKLALVDTSYNGKGVQGTIKSSPNLIALLKSGVTDGKQIASHLTHSKSAKGWLGVRSAARRAMAQGKYNWNWKSLDKYGRQIDSNQYKGPQDWKSSPYYNKYQKGGNLTYSPFIFNDVRSKNTETQESIENIISESEEDSKFPVETVKPWTFGKSVYATYKAPEITRGVTQYKTEGIDVGNMRDLLDKFEEAGISVRVTSGKENRKTKSGKISKHAVADAIDITPIHGETYSDLVSKIKASPELLAYMRENGIGIIDETDLLTKMKTGATGDHWHISRNENFAIYGFNKLFG